MPFITQGKTNWRFLVIVIILVIIVGGGALWYSRRPEKPYQPPEIEKLEKKTPELIFLDATWDRYINYRLGFSMKIPTKIPGLNRCKNPEGTEKQFFVPIKIFEDNSNNIVYITQEYYYDDWVLQVFNEAGECKKFICSLEFIKNWHRCWEWDILIRNISSDTDLDKFIKENYGPGCFAGDKKLWKQDGVYEITIKGEDWDKKGTDLGNTTCPWNHAYKLLYEPKKGKIMSVNLGQECSFYNEESPESESYQCYDKDMIESFRFLE